MADIEHFADCQHQGGTADRGMTMAEALRVMAENQDAARRDHTSYFYGATSEIVAFCNGKFGVRSFHDGSVQ